MTEGERFEKWWRDKKQTKVSPVTLDSTYAHAWEAWRAAKRWVPVEEGLPDIGVEVLCRNIWGDRFVGFIDLRGAWHHVVGTSEEVTHWQPLPLSPDEGEGAYE